MPIAPPPSWFARGLESLLLAAAFAVAHTQSPLYYSNQNQYFLHGLAEGGLGHLKDDWLAQTRDPAPVFTALVAAGYRYAGAWVFQAAYTVVLMGYFLSVRWLVAGLPGLPDMLTFRLAFAALFTAAHSAVLRVASVELIGVDYPWYFQSGVANQYLLGPGLQPSAFGVLLLAGVAAFANGRPVLAAGLAAAACAFHATYLLPAGLLVLGFVVATFRENPHAGPTAFRMLLVASAFAVPVVVYALWEFGSMNHKLFLESQRILAEVRIPHHSVIDRWFAPVDGLQLVWAAVGLAFLRKTRLFAALLVAAAFGLALTLAQYATMSPTLALLFPWRISAVLVPVATAVILARGVSRLPPRAWVMWVSGVLFAGLVAGGAWVMVAGVGYRTADEDPLYEFVRMHAGPHDLYLLPVRIPAVGTGRGTASTTFTPPPRPKPDSNQIPVDLQRFRLLTGVPIYVDFKSVPYADSEVLVWLQRVQQGEEWYANWDRPGVRAELLDAKITHVVAPAVRPIDEPWLKEVHADPAYRVYRVE